MPENANDRSGAKQTDCGNHPDSPPGEIMAAGRRLSFLAAVLISVVAGCVAAGLNAWLMQQQQPVYDSLSYLDRMHRVMSLADRDGVAAGARHAVTGNTVCLPYLIAVLLSPCLAPARWIGTAIQAAGLLIFLVGLDGLLWRSGVHRAGARILAMLASQSLAVMLFTNGGMGDFRMDFSLMLGYGITLSGMSGALRECDARKRWLLFFWTGIAAGATCLVRGTAPVYLVAAAAPVCAWHLYVSRRSPVSMRRIIAGMIILMGTAVVVAGWFYWINLEYLRYYYLVWNTDANARLPWSESIRHVQMVGRAAGAPALVGGMFVAGLFGMWQKKTSDRRFFPGGATAGGIVGEFAWYATVPVAMLVAGGAGLNPFVSMPSVIALYVAVAILTGCVADNLSRGRTVVLWTVVILAVGGAVARGIKKHGWPKEQFMAAHQLALDAMLVDARQSGLQHIRFGSLSVKGVHTDSLWSVIQYDRRDSVFEGESGFMDGRRIEPARLFMRPSVADWEQVPGADDLAKYEWLLQRLPGDIDFLVLPDEATAMAIHESPSPDQINRHLPALRKKILDEIPLRSVAELSSPTESARYQLYRVLQSPPQ